LIPERWSVVKDRLYAALELEGSQRAAYLDDIARHDPELRHELDSLLASHQQASAAFLNIPAIEITTLFPGTSEDMIGRRLGPYQVTQQVGIGGMGEVYRAFRADDEYRKEVAIKLVRAGQASGLILSRFKNERQILASLEHPNICRLLDGGTTQDGLPYLVMELIEGDPIDRYCAEHGLGINERLALFLQVCSAVQFAHQHLIIHRDIKPANVLITKNGAPKLLDFGIAKILDPAATESAGANATLMQVLTPGYASPEQVRGEPITTATDVYSLGVVLYELVTGASPYRVTSTATHEIARAVCEDEPIRPSLLLRQQTEQARERAARRGADEHAKQVKGLRGDVDNIILMALRKEPDRRYASVEQFAGDIRRHLENLPVLAQQDTLRYRASKFVLRHKAGVIAAGIAALALLVGVAAILHEASVARQQAHEAQEQRLRAERRFNDVRKLANSLMFEVHDSIRDLPGATPARKLLVSRALEYLDSLNAEAKNDASLQRELAAAYERIGDVQGQPRQANLGDPAGAASSYKRALALRESLASANAADVEVRRDLVPNYAKLSDLLWSSGDPTTAMEYSTKAISLAQALYKSEPTSFSNRFLFASYLMDHGYKQASVGGNAAEGLQNLEQGSTLLAQLSSEDPKNLKVRRLLGLSYSREAEILLEDPKTRQRAVELYRKSIATKQTLVAADPTNAEFQRIVAYDRFTLAGALAASGDRNAALAQAHESLAAFQKLAANDPANAQFQQDIGRVRGQIGRVLTGMGDPLHGIEQFQLSMATLEKLPDSKNPQTLVGYGIVSDELWLAKAQVRLASAPGATRQQKQQHCREAEGWFRKCIPAFEMIRDHAPAQYGGAATLDEISRESAHCKSLLGAKTAPTH
jgi:eukaryotic-like serine/threonine-protein kinase